ncbi:carbohydrate binding domain-containing protein [Pseudomonas costantinii]|uniref:CBM-cenC domain-containing protein n=2 Tax=Pseudomonas costantinii TaxID=168469 RepID=A0A1H5JLJ6_9PSED|nr:carbohydrate binding domain-containing protein [Pseudomonas costantinii]SEE53356.1 hypothetical protein SAMN04515675_6077 [Pseudomonas costantinii]
MIKEYKRLALRTGGNHYIYTDGLADFVAVLKDTICTGKVPQDESIADRKDEADKLEGVKPTCKPGGGNLCEQLPEIVKAVNTLADVLKNLVEACAPRNTGDKHPCHCHDSGGTGTTPTPKPEVVPFLDVTTFDQSNWNNWTAGPAGHDLKVLESVDGGAAVEFITNAGKNHAGVILKKTLTGLTPGREYSWTTQAKRIIGKYAVPRLSLQVDGKEIASPVDLTKTDELISISGKFTASSDKAELEVVSHTADSKGNDFHISELKIVG